MDVSPRPELIGRRKDRRVCNLDVLQRLVLDVDAFLELTRTTDDTTVEQKEAA